MPAMKVSPGELFFTREIPTVDAGVSPLSSAVLAGDSARRAVAALFAWCRATQGRTPLCWVKVRGNGGCCNPLRLGTCPRHLCSARPRLPPLCSFALLEDQKRAAFLGASLDL